MPDLFILLAIVVLVIIGIVAICAFFEDAESGAGIGFLVCLVLAVGSAKWWHWSLDVREWTTTAVYPIQNIDTPDGSQIQVFIVDSTIHNATQRWGKVLAEGTWVRRVDCQTKTRGVRHWLTGGYKFEIIAPNEGSENGD